MPADINVHSFTDLQERSIVNNDNFSGEENKTDQNESMFKSVTPPSLPMRCVSLVLLPVDG